MDANLTMKGTGDVLSPAVHCSHQITADLVQTADAGGHAGAANNATMLWRVHDAL
jgi:hypothetical protein